MGHENCQRQSCWSNSVHKLKLAPLKFFYDVLGGNTLNQKPISFSLLGALEKVKQNNMRSTFVKLFDHKFAILRLLVVMAQNCRKLRCYLIKYCLYEILRLRVCTQKGSF